VSVEDVLSHELYHALADVVVVLDVYRPGVVVLDCITDTTAAAAGHAAPELE